jgi:dolichyl-phosphate-mannose--protein O-mannosyl transferase
MNPGSIWISEESEVIKQQEQMSGKKDQQMGDNTDMWQLEQREHTMMDIEQNCIEKGRKVDQGGGGGEKS